MLRLASASLALATAIVIIGSGPGVAAGSNAKAHGAELFAEKGCPQCHGANGVGGGRGPDLQQVRNRLNAEQMEKQIHDGGQAMPAYGDQLTAAEIKDIVAFLHARRKQIIVAPPKPDVQPSVTPAKKNPDDDSL